MKQTLGLVLALLLLLLASCEKVEKAAASIAAPQYMTLLGEGLSGSGFHFAHNGEHYIACSLHQFENQSPTVMGHMDFDAPIKILKQVGKQYDVQILTFDSKELSSLEPLSYTPSEDLSVGMPVFLYDFDDVYSGHITKAGSGEKEYKVKLTKPYPAGGNSGTPVVSGVTGNVVGVLLSANSSERASTVGFERLTWDSD